MKPRRTVLAPSLERWSREADPTERRSVIVRIDMSGNPKAAAARLAEVGAEIESAGPGSITIVVTPSVARSVTEQPGVLAVEEPTRLIAEPVESPAPGS